MYKLFIIYSNKGLELIGIDLKEPGYRVKYDYVYKQMIFSF